MVNPNWKQVATGVVAASVGATALGAVHYMFLAPQYGAGSLMGVPMSTVLPIVLGIIGFVGAGFIGAKYGTAKDVLLFGSAASIGFGIAQYAGWVTPKPVVAAAPARAFVPTMGVSVPMMAAPSVTKII